MAASLFLGIQISGSTEGPTHPQANSQLALRAMDSADRAEPEVAELKTGRLQEKIEALRQQIRKLKDIEAQMRASSDQQVSLTDPDARSMKNLLSYGASRAGKTVLLENIRCDSAPSAVPIRV